MIAMQWTSYQLCLLKACIDFFAPIIALLANLSLQEGSCHDAFKTKKFCRYSRNLDWMESATPTFGPFPIDRQSGKFWRNSYSNDWTTFEVVAKLQRPTVGLRRSELSWNSDTQKFRWCAVPCLRRTADCPCSARRLSSIRPDYPSEAVRATTGRIWCMRFSSFLDWILTLRSISVRKQMRSTLQQQRDSVVPRGLVLEPLLFVVNVSPAGGVINRLRIRSVIINMLTIHCRQFQDLNKHHINNWEMHHKSPEMISSEWRSTKPWQVGGSITGISSTTPCLYGRFTATGRQWEAEYRWVSALAWSVHWRWPYDGRTSDGNLHIMQLSHPGTEAYLTSSAAERCYGCCWQHRVVETRLLQPLLYDMSHCNLLKLQSVQNTVARVVMGVPRRTHADDLLRKLPWFLVNTGSISRSQHSRSRR